MKKIIVITILMMLVFTTVVSAAMYQDVDVNQKFYVLEGSDPTSERDFAWSTDFTIKEAKRVADEIFTEDMSVREKVAAVYFWFTRNLEYRPSHSGVSVEKSVTDKLAVCEQYAQFGADILAVSGVRTYTVISIRADHAVTVYMSEDGSWLTADFSDSTPISTLALEFQMNEYGLSRAEVLEKYNLISNGPNKYWYGSFDIWLEYNPYFFPNGHFSKKVELPKFTDVASGSWYHNYVYGVLDTGLMIGSNGMFNPNKNLSIDELVTVAVRLHAKENLATIRSANNGEHWSTPYKEYAIKNAIVDSSFVKDGTRKATREELAYALYGAKTPIKTREAVYTVEDVTPKYQQAVLVMHEAEILNGVGNSLAPKAFSNRAQLATMLVRLMY